jgi:hypothetical protein
VTKLAADMERSIGRMAGGGADARDETHRSEI